MSKYISSKDELAKRLRYMRKHLNYTQQEIAEYLGITRYTYAYYESNKTLPDIFRLLKLSSLYKINIEYLFIDNDKKLKRCLDKASST